MFPSYRNQLVDLLCKSTNWFLYDANVGRGLNLLLFVLLYSWEYFTHDQSRSRAYRWGEDGLMGFTDRECRLCFGLSLWNTKDPILKERLFGLINSEGMANCSLYQKFNFSVIFWVCKHARIMGNAKQKCILIV